ncbi:universal stress protein [Promicromonospora sp. CA-289599]|uniref:universal stress protein n=1 Tax=Promicromonospora sp. CA-289599 TaxID=3240014 RepID=UPI003D9471EA
MSTTWYHDIVVGIDGSHESLAALDWAARAADLHRAHLTVVAAYAPPMTPDPGIGDPIGELRDQAHRAVQAARTQLAEHHPEAGDVEFTVTPGAASYVLGQRAQTCDLVVVGRRGLGKFDRMVLGSTSSALAAAAGGAVAVVPAGATTGDPHRIRVGVGRDDEPDVLGAAFAEANVRGCPLEVFHVTASDPIASAVLEMEPVAGSWQEAARAALADRVARWSEKYPRVTCSIVIRRGDTVAALRNGVTTDDLVIVGGRRHSRAMGRMLGSVPDALLRSAPCSIMVVHAHHHAHD